MGGEVEVKDVGMPFMQGGPLYSSSLLWVNISPEESEERDNRQIAGSPALLQKL